MQSSGETRLGVNFRARSDRLRRPRRAPVSVSTWAARNDLRGFDIRPVSPIAFLANRAFINLTNPDGTTVSRIRPILV